MEGGDTQPAALRAALMQMPCITLDEELLCTSVTPPQGATPEDMAQGALLQACVGRRAIAASPAPLADGTTAPPPGETEPHAVDSLAASLHRLRISADAGTTPAAPYDVTFEQPTDTAGIYLVKEASPGEPIGATFTQDSLALLHTTPGGRADRSGLTRYAGGLWKLRYLNGARVATTAELVEACRAAPQAEGFSVVLQAVESCSVRIAVTPPLPHPQDMKEGIPNSIPGGEGAEGCKSGEKKAKKQSEANDPWPPTPGQLYSALRRYGALRSVLPLGEADGADACGVGRGAPARLGDTPLCGHPVEPGDRFCSECGEAVVARGEAAGVGGASGGEGLWETYATFADVESAARCVGQIGRDCPLGASACSAMFDHSGVGEVQGAEVEEGGKESRFAETPVRALLHRHGFFNPFFVLGVPLDATGEEVRKAYRRCALAWHPDKQHVEKGGGGGGEPNGGDGVCLEGHPFARSPGAVERKQLFEWAVQAKEMLLDAGKRQEIQARIDESVQRYGRRAVYKMFPSR